MADKEKDPDNVWVNEGKKDVTKVYIKTPFNYRSAQAAIKAVDGAKFMGDAWEMDKTAFAAAEAAIRAGAQEDKGMTKEARAEREAGLKAAKPEKAAKVELTEEEKAAKAEAAKARAAEADKTRVPVIAGSVEAGGEVTVDGNTVTVAELGAAWDLDADGAERLKARFPDVEGIVAGVSVQFAKFTVPEPAEEPGM